MIGAMPAVAVRHERRRQEKRSKRPSQLYLGGPWLPPPSPSPTPSPGANGLNYDADDRFPEYYVCGKVSALQLVVGSLLLGAIVLVVGLVQLTPGATDADHRWILLGTGSALIASGLALTAVRCCCMRYEAPEVAIEPENDLNAEGRECECEGVRSIDGLVQRKDTQIGSPSELAALITKTDETTTSDPPSVPPTSHQAKPHQRTDSTRSHQHKPKCPRADITKRNTVEPMDVKSPTIHHHHHHHNNTIKKEPHQHFTRTDSLAISTRTESLDSGGGGGT